MIRNYFKLLFGTRGTSRKLNETYFLQRRNKGKDLYPGEPHRVLLGFPVFVEHVRHVQLISIIDFGGVLSISAFCVCGTNKLVNIILQGTP